MLLAELLDETAGDTKFKHKTRKSINELTKQLESVLEVNIEDNLLSKLLTDSVGVLENTIQKGLNE